MPLIKSAKKKLRKDIKRTERNAKTKVSLSKALKLAAKKPSASTVKAAAKLADIAAKNKIIHKNKAARIKSSLSKLVKSPAKKTETPKTNKSKTSKAKK